jgi:hypothetical protein
LTQFLFPSSIRIHLIPGPQYTEIIPPRASFARRFGSEARIAAALVALGAILMASNPWFTPVDDEIAIINVAARPAWATMKLFLSGGGQHEHPPLSDLLLHEWLWLSNGNIQLLRLLRLFSMCWEHGFWCKRRGEWLGTALETTR